LGRRAAAALLGRGIAATDEEADSGRHAGVMLALLGRAGFDGSALALLGRAGFAGAEQTTCTGRGPSRGELQDAGRRLSVRLILARGEQGLANRVYQALACAACS